MAHPDSAALGRTVRAGLAAGSLALLVGLLATPTVGAADSAGARVAAEPSSPTSTSATAAPPGNGGGLLPLLPVPAATAGTPSAPAPQPGTPPPPAPRQDPLAGLSAKARAEYRRCSPRRVGPGSGGSCARLLQKRLKAAGYYPWPVVRRITVAGANAILNYQRSRGLPPTGIAAKRTWLALVKKAPAASAALPKKCFAEGVVICVDQGRRRLFWLKNRVVVKTVKVRLGGYNSHPKTGKWRVFPTANGTWRVYDKQVDPKSENYGSGAMPYSTMFYPDMYVHYSPGFHSVGYAGSSHGCVNVGSLKDAIWIFRHTPIGARVHIFTPRL